MLFNTKYINKLQIECTLVTEHPNANIIILIENREKIRESIRISGEYHQHAADETLAALISISSSIPA